MLAPCGLLPKNRTIHHERILLRRKIWPGGCSRCNGPDSPTRRLPLPSRRPSRGRAWDGSPAKWASASRPFTAERKFGGTACGVRKFKQLEGENTRLHRLVASHCLDKKMLQEVICKSSNACSTRGSGVFSHLLSGKHPVSVSELFRPTLHLLSVPQS